MRVVVVQPLSCVQLFATSWIAAPLASMSFTISQSLLKLMCFELVMPSSHLIFCHPFLLMHSIFPSIRSFPMSLLSISGGQSIGASASASILPMNIQGWFPLGLSGLISLPSKGLSKVFYSITIWKLQCSAFFMVQLSHPHMTTGITLIAQLVKNSPAVQETLVLFLGWEDLLEKG